MVGLRTARKRLNSCTKKLAAKDVTAARHIVRTSDLGILWVRSEPVMLGVVGPLEDLTERVVMLIAYELFPVRNLSE